MQWDKVKNVLIVILAAVNLFLLGNLGARLWQNMQREAELDSSLRTLAQGYGLTLDEDFKLPDDKELPELSVDRSRQDEEAVAAAALGELRRHADAEHPARDRDPVCVYHVLYQNFSRQIRAEKAESVREAYERQN